jgi:hypothetical protein
MPLLAEAIVHTIMLGLLVGSRVLVSGKKKPGERHVEWAYAFLLLVPVALIVRSFGLVPLHIATAGAHLMQGGLPKLGWGPTNLDNVGRSLVWLGLIVFFGVFPFLFFTG